MAKMFYTMDEAKTALGKTEGEIRGFIGQGLLREFRDGKISMFKSDQIESLRSRTGLSEPTIEQPAPLGLSLMARLKQILPLIDVETIIKLTSGTDARAFSELLMWNKVPFSFKCSENQHGQCQYIFTGPKENSEDCILFQKLANSIPKDSLKV